jgi:preprotein translocase SecE subunit
MTATLASLLIVYGAAWVWTQLGVVKLPTPKWNMSIRDGGFQGSPGAAVELLGKGVRDGEYIKIGDAAITEWTAATKGHDAAIESIVMVDNRITSETVAIRAAASPDAVGIVEGRPAGIPIFQPVYLQAGGAGLVLALGAILVFWQVGLKHSTVDFLIATDSEMKKVNWSTRREVTGITQVVIIAFFMIAAVIFVIDYLFSVFFGLIHVIRSAGG